MKDTISSRNVELLRFVTLLSVAALFWLLKISDRARRFSVFHPSSDFVDDQNVHNKQDGHGDDDSDYL